MTVNYSPAVETARSYYNSDDADNFYFHVWGGEDIHIGLYESPSDSVYEASRRTIRRMVSHLKALGPETRVLDLGAGYGGAARYLASRHSCRVSALNLSEKENERNRAMNREQKLDHLIDVVDSSFEEVPYPDETFDVVWSQDAFLHSGQRRKVIHEAARVLKPGGELVFTDPMQSDDCPEGVLQPILDRIHLETLGSPARYREHARQAGLDEAGFEELTPQLPEHYARVLAVLEDRQDDLEGLVSRDYIERMKKGLSHWINGGRKGHLAWGIFHFCKP